MVGRQMALVVLLLIQVHKMAVEYRLSNEILPHELNSDIEKQYRIRLIEKCRSIGC